MLASGASEVAEFAAAAKTLNSCMKRHFFNSARRQRAVPTRTYDKGDGLTYATRHRKKARQHLLEFMGNKCVRCGFDDPRALQVDHIHGNGSQERRRMSQAQVNARVYEHPGDYQLLCANCNWIKRAEQAEAKGPTRKSESQAKVPSPPSKTLGNLDALPVTY